MGKIMKSEKVKVQQSPNPSSIFLLSNPFLSSSSFFEFYIKSIVTIYGDQNLIILSSPPLFSFSFSFLIIENRYTSIQIWFQTNPQLHLRYFHPSILANILWPNIPILSSRKKSHREEFIRSGYLISRVNDREKSPPPHSWIKIYSLIRKIEQLTEYSCALITR